MAKQPKNASSDASGKKKRNTVFLTLDDDTEARLQRWLDRQRVQPDRAAVGLQALKEFLDREEKRAE